LGRRPRSKESDTWHLLRLLRVHGKAKRKQDGADR